MAEGAFCCLPLCNLPIRAPAIMLRAMRTQLLLLLLALPCSPAFGQASTTAPSFDVASVKPSLHQVGPDYNNQLTYSPNGITARNVTVKRLVAEAYHLQQNQIQGPGWLGQNEYDVDAKTADAASREQMALMLQSLLADRFHLVKHSETREMGVYELVVGRSGPRIHAMKEGEAGGAQSGFHFHGDLRQFADLLAVQLSIPAPENPNEPVRASQSTIPVLDKTGLPGIFDFNVDMHPELGTDMFTSWQRALQDQLGLSIENRKGNVAVMVVDEAAKIPTEN
jgi:uncharacterized protein (TIGR03435 family)